MYMQDDDIKCKNCGIALPKVFALATEIGENDEKRPIIAQEFMDELTNDSYCRHKSCTVLFPGLTYIYDRNGIFTLVALVDGAVQKVIPMSLFVLLLYQS